MPFGNNLAERSIRPAVILRKNSNGHRSPQGAETQAILMSVFFTLKKRGYNSVKVIREALSVYLETGQLPPLPENTAADR
ncbi:MAG: transposase [Candidatus Hydrogenedentota bacterium]